MSDHYREVSGQPEMSVAEEASVDDLVQLMFAELKKVITGSELEDLVWDAVPRIGLADDALLETWDAAIAQFRWALIYQLGWDTP